MSTAARKRFYAHVGAMQQEENWCVQLDGKTVHTPRGHRLYVPSANLAHAIAAEWDAQIDVIAPRSMHLTTLACTCIDGVMEKRTEVIHALLSFANTDQLSFRDDQNEKFYAAQSAALDKWVAWADEVLGVQLAVTRGVMPVPQPAKNAVVLQKTLEEMNVLELTATAHLVEQLRSMVLGLAVFKRALTAQEAFRLSSMEELYQIEEWGIDEELQNRLERTLDEVLAARAVSSTALSVRDVRNHE